MTEKNNHISGLPKGWKWVKVSTIAELFRGINYTKDVASNNPFKEGLPILRGNNINGELNFDDLVYVPKTLIKKEQFIKKDDIIFAMSSGSKHLVGKSAVAKNDFKGSYGAFCALLRINEEVNKKYISYVFKGNSYRKLISEIAKGTNINNLKREHILDFELPLPPKHTQPTIVSKIEELFSELDKGIENLRLAQQQLKIYRQSVLKWAFEGKELSSFENFINSSQNGLSKRTGIKGEKYKVLRLADISNNIIDDSNPREIVMDENEIEKYKIKTDDLICIRVNGSKDLVGRLVHVSSQNEKDNWAFCDHFIRFRLNSEKAFSKYFHYYFSTLIVRKYIQDNMVTSAGQNTVSQGTIKNVSVPVVSLEEQKNIVQQIESRLSVADKMEESITQSLQQAEALRQSILKKAFEGRLV